MIVNVQSHHVTIPSHGDHELVSLTRSVLARFDQGISRVDLTLKDENGPRGGKDKLCMVKVELADGTSLIVKDLSTNLRKAIYRALHRAKVRVAAQCAEQKSLDRTFLRQQRRFLSGSDRILAAETI